MNDHFSALSAVSGTTPPYLRRLTALACMAGALLIGAPAQAQPADPSGGAPADPAAQPGDGKDKPAPTGAEQPAGTEQPEPGHGQPDNGQPDNRQPADPDGPAGNGADAPAPAGGQGASEPPQPPGPGPAGAAGMAAGPVQEPLAADPKRDGRDWWRDKVVLELGPIRLAPVAFLSAQLAPYVGGEAFFQSGDPAERAGFRLRNARLGFDTSYEDQARLRVTGEIGSETDGEMRVHDAWFGYTPLPEVGIFVGAQRAPFGRFAQIPSGQTALIQRPLGTSALSPGHQIGATVQGAIENGMFRYAAGVFNGLQRGLTFYEGYQRNYSPFGNRFDGLSALARVSTEPLGPLARPAADEEQGEPRLGIGANYLFSDGGSRDIHSAGGDAHLQVMGFHTMAEFIWSLSLPEIEPTQPDAPTAEVTSLTFAGEAGYVIIERMLNVAARFEWVDPDTLSDDESDNWLITAGAGVYLVDQLLRAQVEYTHREEMNGQSLDNDVVLLQFQAQIDPGSVPPDAAGSAPAAARLLTPGLLRGAM